MDSQITLFLYHLASQSDFLTLLTRILSNYVIPVLIISLILILIFKKHWTNFIMSILGVGIAYAVSQLMSLVINRPRPFVALGGQIKPLVDIISDSSFPSDHTVVAFALAAVIALNFKKKWLTITLLIVAPLVGISRIAAGVHYSTDILGGIIIGILIPYLWLKELRRK